MYSPHASLHPLTPKPKRRRKESYSSGHPQSLQNEGEEESKFGDVDDNAMDVDDCAMDEEQANPEVETPMINYEGDFMSDDGDDQDLFDANSVYDDGDVAISQTSDTETVTSESLGDSPNDSPQSIGRKNASSREDNSFFECIRKEMKANGQRNFRINARETRRYWNLGRKGVISPDVAFLVSRENDIQLKLLIEAENYRVQQDPSSKGKYVVQLVLKKDGRYASNSSEARDLSAQADKRFYTCDVCYGVIAKSVKDIHDRFHDTESVGDKNRESIALEEKQSLEERGFPVAPHAGEAPKAFSARYKRFYVERILASMMTLHPVYLTGPGGYGKSECLMLFEKTLKKCSFPKDSFLKLSHQGIAAQSIGGHTLYSYFRFSSDGFSDPEFIEKYEKKNFWTKRKDKSVKSRFLRKLIGVKVVVIDEISNVDGRVLTIVDQIFRRVTQISAESFDDDDEEEEEEMNNSLVTEVAEDELEEEDDGDETVSFDDEEFADLRDVALYDTFLELWKEKTQLNGGNGMFGNLFSLLLGDLTQLPPIDKETPPCPSYAWREFVHLRPLPMVYPWRFTRLLELNNGEEDTEGRLHAEFLAKLRMAEFDVHAFVNLPYRILSYDEFFEDQMLKDVPILTPRSADGNHHKGLLHRALGRSSAEDLWLKTQIFKVIDVSDKKVSATGYHPLQDLKTYSRELPDRYRDGKKYCNYDVYEAVKKITTKSWVEPVWQCMDHDDAGLRGNIFYSSGTKQKNLPLVTWLKIQDIAVVRENYTGFRSDGDSTQEVQHLMNGSIVTVLGLNQNKDLRVMFKGAEFVVPRVTRQKKLSSKNFLLAWGYPIDAANVMSITKSQSLTLKTAAIDCNDFNTVRHFFHGQLTYVGTSRVQNPRNLVFLVHPKILPRGISNHKERRIWFAQRVLRDPKITRQNPTVLDLSRRATMEDTLRLEYTSEEQYFERVRAMEKSHYFEKWEHSVRSPLRLSERGNSSDGLAKVNVKEEGGLVFNFAVIHDIETCRDMDYKNENFCPQITWLCCVLVIINGKVPLMSDYEELEQFQRYQSIDDRKLRFHLKQYPEDKDKAFCDKVFIELIIALCRIKQDQIESIKPCGSRTNLMYEPINWFGYNISGFDFVPLVRMMQETRLLEDAGLSVGILRNNGSSITTMSFKGQVSMTPKRKRSIELLQMRDMLRVIGQGTLRENVSAFKNVVECINDLDFMDNMTKRSELFMENVDSTIVSSLRRAFAEEKDYFPYLLTQTQGVDVTLDDTTKDIELSCYDPKDRETVQREQRNVGVNLFQHAHEYAGLDIDCTLLLVVAFNKLVMDRVNSSIVRVMTMQQLTTLLFCEETFRDLQKHNENKGRIEKRYEKGFSPGVGYVKYTFNIPVYTRVENEFLRRSIYGGKVLPQILGWSKSSEMESYHMLDVSSMYGAILMRNEFPTGRHKLDSHSVICERVLKLIQEGPPDHVESPPLDATFPHLFVAEIEFTFPSLLLNPSVPLEPCKDDSSIPWDVTRDSRTKCRGVYTCVDIANILRDGGKVERVFCVMYWEAREKVMTHYATAVNKAKAEAAKNKNVGNKQFNKLLNNSLYGATLKKRMNTEVSIIPLSELKKEENKLDPKGMYLRIHPESMTVTISGTLREDKHTHSERPTHFGAFVLSYSRKMNQRFVQIAQPAQIPQCVDQAREMLRTPCVAYGDTDSMIIPRSAFINLIVHDMFHLSDRLLLHEKMEGVDGIGRLEEDLADLWETQIFERQFPAFRDTLRKSPEDFSSKMNDLEKKCTEKNFKIDVAQFLKRVQLGYGYGDNMAQWEVDFEIQKCLFELLFKESEYKFKSNLAAFMEKFGPTEQERVDYETSSQELRQRLEEVYRTKVAQNFDELNCVRIERLAANGPKSYTLQGAAWIGGKERGKMYKTKVKGIMRGSRVKLMDQGQSNMDQGQSVVEIANSNQSNLQGDGASTEQFSFVDESFMIEGAIVYKLGTQDTHHMFYSAFTDPSKYLLCTVSHRIEKVGLIEKSLVATRTDGITEKVKAGTIGITNDTSRRVGYVADKIMEVTNKEKEIVEPSVGYHTERMAFNGFCHEFGGYHFASKFRGRRMLTEDEARYLGILSDEGGINKTSRAALEWRRLMVPVHFNYDNGLYNLESMSYIG